MVGVFAAIAAVAHAAARSHDEIGLVFEHQLTLYTARADGNQTSGLWPASSKGVEHERSAAWSPDGRRLAYFGRAGRLTIVDVDSGRTRTVSTACSSSPSYSPDGQRLLCADSDGTTYLRQNGRERLIDSDEGLGDESVSEATFGPDGRIEPMQAKICTSFAGVTRACNTWRCCAAHSATAGPNSSTGSPGRPTASGSRSDSTKASRAAAQTWPESGRSRPVVGPQRRSPATGLEFRGPPTEGGSRSLVSAAAIGRSTLCAPVAVTSAGSRTARGEIGHRFGDLDQVDRSRRRPG